MFTLSGDPLYDLGRADFGEGLERIAEDGNPGPLAAARADVVVFDTPVGATSPGMARPGGAYEIVFTANAGDRLAFATMFGMSNDWLFATPPEGIAIVPGDVTDQLLIVDLGTEADEEPAIGPDTAPQQPAPNTGPTDPDTFARPASYDRSVDQHLMVTLARVRE